MTLDPKYRSVIYLHYYEGYSCRELAKLMGLSESAVRMRAKGASITTGARSAPKSR